MAATVQSKAGDLVVEMNTTPLIDVMLVLLTLLIITLPLQTNAIKIDRPQQSSHAQIDLPPVVLGIDWDGTMTWDGTEVDRATLDSYLADAARKDPQPEIHIRADRLAKYSAVAMVLADAARAGDTRIGFDNAAFN